MGSTMYNPKFGKNLLVDFCKTFEVFGIFCQCFGSENTTIMRYCHRWRKVFRAGNKFNFFVINQAVNMENISGLKTLKENGYDLHPVFPSLSRVLLRNVFFYTTRRRFGARFQNPWCRVFFNESCNNTVIKNRSKGWNIDTTVLCHLAHGQFVPKISVSRLTHSLYTKGFPD